MKLKSAMGCREKYLQQSCIARFSSMAREMHRESHQPQEALRKSSAQGQYSKDKEALAEVGSGSPSPRMRGRILEDRLTPLSLGLTLRDRLLLMLALQHLAAEGTTLLPLRPWKPEGRLPENWSLPSEGRFSAVLILHHAGRIRREIGRVAVSAGRRS